MLSTDAKCLLDYVEMNKGGEGQLCRVFLAATKDYNRIRLILYTDNGAGYSKLLADFDVTKEVKSELESSGQEIQVLNTSGDWMTVGVYRSFDEAIEALRRYKEKSPYTKFRLTAN